jgi:hypothetical protein
MLAYKHKIKPENKHKAVVERRGFRPKISGNLSTRFNQNQSIT